MSSKGITHSPATRLKQSLANRKLTNTEQIKRAQEYISYCEANPKHLPNDASFALALSLTSNALLEAVSYNPELVQYLDQVHTKQRVYLLTRGIEGKTQPAITALLLKSKHGYQENPANLTQNNYMNVSPDVLKTALELMKKPANT